MSESKRRWLSIGALFVGILALAVMLLRPGPDETATEDAPPAATEPIAGEREAAAGDGPATREILDGCEPVEAVRTYEEFLGGRALAILSWIGMPERAAKLRIPVYVDAIEGGAIHVRFMQFPLRDQYVALWLESGHIRPGPGDLFLLDPCSATIVPWPTQRSDEPADETPSN